MFALLCHLTSECCPAAGGRWADHVQMQSHAESGHEQERKIALSVSLEKNRRNVVNFDAARTANEACGYIMLQHRSSSICINAWWKTALWKWNFQEKFMLCFQDIHDWTMLREFLIQICDPEPGSRISLDNMSVQWMYFEPESRNGNQKGPAFADIFENYCDANMTEARRVKFKIAKCYSRGGIFLAFVGV